MKTLMMILTALVLSACAGGSGGDSTPGDNGNGGGNSPSVHEYRVRVIGSAINYVAEATTNFGDSDQVQTPISAHNISGAGYEDNTVFGRNVIVQGVMNSGASMTIELYKDGTLVDTQSTTQTGATVIVREGI